MVYHHNVTVCLLYAELIYFIASFNGFMHPQDIPAETLDGLVLSSAASLDQASGQDPEIRGYRGRSCTGSFAPFLTG